MTIDPEFLDMMSETITVEPLTGADNFGNNTYGTPVTGVRARPENPTYTTEIGVVESGSVQGAPSETIRFIIDFVDPGFEAGSRVTHDRTAQQYVVTSAATEYDEHGPYYQDLTCANNQER